MPIATAALTWAPLLARLLSATAAAVGASSYSNGVLCVWDTMPVVAHVGEAIPIDVDVLNRTGVRRSFYDFGGLPSVVHDAAGKILPLRREYAWLRTGNMRDVVFNGRFVRYPPGQVTERHIDLAECYDLDVPGLYWVQVGHPIGDAMQLRPVAWPWPRPLLVLAKPIRRTCPSGS